MIEKIAVELSEEEALAFAAFLKRLLPDDYRRHADSEEEAWLMHDASLQIVRSLYDKGFDPR